jgi:hypothetical protein
MTMTIEKRIETLEQQAGADDFARSLTGDDARDYRRIMASMGDGDYRAFVRTLADGDLDRLIEIHTRRPDADPL